MSLFGAQIRVEQIGALFRPFLSKPPRGRCLDRGRLIAILMLGAAVLGFAVISVYVIDGETYTFDRWVLLQLRNPDDLADPIGPAWLAIAARDTTSLGGFTVLSLAGIIAAGYLTVIRQFVAAALLVVTVGGGMILSTFLKLGFDRSRPNLVPHAVEVYTLSFPSSHAMLSAVTYLTLGALLAQAQQHRREAIYILTIAVVLCLLIGSSRVYLGVHWPTDVLAGWCIGTAWALACWLIATFIHRR